MKSNLLLALAVLLCLGLALLGSGWLGGEALGSGGELGPQAGAAAPGAAVAGDLEAPLSRSAAAAGREPLSLPEAEPSTERAAAAAGSTILGWSELRIRVVDALTREGVQGVGIRRASADGSRFRGEIDCTRLDNAGEYELRWKGPALLDFEIEAPGYLGASVNASVARASESDVLVQLVRPARLIVHADGFTATAPGVIEVYRGKDARRGSPLDRQSWKGERSIVFEGLIPDTVSVVMTVKGCAPGAMHGVPLIAGETAEVTVRAPAGEIVQGVILEAGTEEPLGGVLVRVRPEVSGLSAANERAPFPAVESDRAGRFSVAGIPVGRAVVTLESPGGARVDRPIVVIEGNATRELRLRMTGAGTLSGRVTGRSAFAPQEGVLILPKGDARSVMGALLNRKSDLAKARGTFAPIQQGGSFAATAVPAGRQLLVIHRDRAGTLSFVDVKEPLALGESRAGIVLELADPPRRSFRVTDTAGHPVESIEVAFEERLAGTTGWSVWTAMESATGTFAYQGQAPVARRLRVRAEGYASAALRWREGEVPTIEIRRARDVSFVVVGVHGRALRGVRLRAESIPDGPVEAARKKPRGHQRRASTDRYGRGSIELDPAFTWRVTAHLPAYEVGGPVMVRADDGGEGTIPFRIVLEPKVEPEPATVRGRIVRAGSGAPIFDLDFVGLRGGTFRVEGSDFEIRGLPPGEAAITAQSGGFETVQLPVKTLRAGETVDVGVLSVRPATRIDVTVKDVMGKRVRGAKVSLHRLPSNQGGRADLPQRVRIPEANGAQGVYRKAGVGRAKWRLVVQQGRNQRVSRIVTLSGARKRVQVDLGKGK